MLESVVDVLFLSFFCSLLFGVAAVGILALPWKDDELADTARAVRHAWRRLDDALRIAGTALRPSPAPRRQPVLPEAFRRRGYLGDGPSVAFEPPSMPA